MRSIGITVSAVLLIVAVAGCGGTGESGADAGSDAQGDAPADASGDGSVDGIGDLPDETGPDVADDPGSDVRRDVDAGSDVVCQCTANEDCAGRFLGLGPCERAVCDPDTCACVRANAPEDEPCDDGNPCTEGGACRVGECLPGTNLCACASDADCASKEDGDLCNGTLACVDPGPSGNCLVDSATIVVCPDLLEPCRANSCDPATGACVPAAVREGESCDDLDPCTTGDTCTGGTCLATGVRTCDDDEPCTSDACEPGRGCVYRPNALPCDDGNPCTVGDACREGGCLAGPLNPCDDGDACTSDACNPATGACLHVPPVVDDGDPCTIDACDPRTGAITHVAKDCGDGNPCTDDGCTPATGACFHVPVPGRACDDGRDCTDLDACDALGVCRGTRELCCADQVDDDGDGLTDCQDPDCVAETYCS